jgi:hypothetical protein
MGIDRDAGPRQFCREGKGMVEGFAAVFPCSKKKAGVDERAGRRKCGLGIAKPWLSQ